MTISHLYQRRIKMKKSLIKTIVTLTLALSFLFAGVFAVSNSYVASTNSDVLLAHDGPTNDMMVY